MSISNLLLVFMFTGFTITNTLTGQLWLALAFCIYGVLFGLEEFLADKLTGKTVSQHIQYQIKTEPHKGFAVIGCMLLAWLCWLWHFSFTEIMSNVIFSLFFVILLGVGIGLKQYLLAIAGLIFTSVIIFVDHLAMKHSGVTILSQMQALKEVHPLFEKINMISMLVGWLCLLVHLSVRFKK